jgi:hypothetical protein
MSVRIELDINEDEAHSLRDLVFQVIVKNMDWLPPETPVLSVATSVYDAVTLALGDEL